jgi:hypothetical protein
LTWRFFLHDKGRPSGFFFAIDCALRAVFFYVGPEGPTHKDSIIRVLWIFFAIVRAVRA